MFNWGFRATLKIHQAESKDICFTKSDTQEKITYQDFIKSLNILDANKKIWLNPLLFNGILQTIYYSSAGSKDQFNIYYGREIFKYQDEGSCSLDWIIPDEEPQVFKAKYSETIPEDWPRLHPRTRFFSKQELSSRLQHGQDKGSKKPICVVIHGLGGGSHETVIRNLGHNLTRDANEGKWDVVVINSRGCCRTKITSGKTFNLLSTNDIKEVVMEIKKRYPTRPIFGVGFSFGAALLSNYLALQADSDEKLIEVASLIGCPWDMLDSSSHIEKSWSGKYLFSPAITSFMVKLVKNNYKELHEHLPQIYNPETIAKIKHFTRSEDFADNFTCFEAGFKTGHDYYAAGSPVVNMHKINVPVLGLNSTDDPTVSVKLPIEKVMQNANICLVETDLGGHLGFVQSGGKFWSVELVEQFFNHFYDQFYK